MREAQGAGDPDRVVSTEVVRDFVVQTERQRARMLGALHVGPGERPTVDDLALALEELRTAEEELRAQNEELLVSRARIEHEHARYRDLFHRAPVPYLVTDAEAVIRDANGACGRLLVVDPRLLVGKPLLVFIPERARRVLRRKVAGLGREEGTVELRFEIKPRRGRRRAMSATVGVVRDRAGRVIELRWLLADRSDRRARAAAARTRRAELERLVAERTEEARLAREHAEQANRAKSEFVARISHELRTPLNAISGYAELLAMGARGELTRSQSDDVERIREAQEHLTLLVEDLLYHVRCEVDGFRVDAGEVIVHDAVRFAGRLLAPQARTAGVALRTIPGALDAVVRADAERLRQIIVNLLANAIKFTPSGGEVTIGWEAAADSVDLRVSDTGVGIAESELESIFRPFTQLGGEQSLARGVGLGLSISRELARAMGGDLTATSRVGEGSVFTLRLRRSTRVAAGSVG